MIALRDFRAGDAELVEMDEPWPERYRGKRPSGHAFTAVNCLGVPVACIGFHRRPDGEVRVWARLERSLGPSSINKCFRHARALLTCYEDVTLTATAPSARVGKCFSRFGFRPVMDDAPYPKLYQRRPS